MTIARKRLVPPETTPYYHVICRCVRRDFLCGVDARFGVDFEHRRQWIVDRLGLLSHVFAIDIATYAVMSNHLHLVVRIDVTAPPTWSDEEVMDRWSQVYGVHPLIAKAAQPGTASALVESAQELIQLRRNRLSDLSWFMKCLNEFSARKSNREDHCRGAFWEGRFKSQALLDEQALLECMVYVDLNPVRANMASPPEESDFTSVKQRLVADEDPSIPMLSFQSQGADSQSLPMGVEEYLALVDWTRRRVDTGKRGSIPGSLSPIFNRLGTDEAAWVNSMQPFRNAELCALGPLDALNQLASSLFRNWFRGSTRCKAIFGIS